MVKYAEQDREVQKCSYLGPNGSEVAILFILILFLIINSLYLPCICHVFVCNRCNVCV